MVSLRERRPRPRVYGRSPVMRENLAESFVLERVRENECLVVPFPAHCVQDGDRGRVRLLLYVVCVWRTTKSRVRRNR